MNPLVNKMLYLSILSIYFWFRKYSLAHSTNFFWETCYASKEKWQYQVNSIKSFFLWISIAIGGYRQNISKQK
jgi:hypothetical protein